MTDRAPDPRAQVLRAAGHREAADLLDSLAGLEPSPPAEPGQGAPATVSAASTPESQRQAQAEGLLAQLRRDTQGRWGVPVAEEPAR